MDFLSNDKFSRQTAFWGNLWTTKAEQLYKKADILFKNDDVAVETYTEIKKTNKRFKNIAYIRMAAAVLLLLVVLIFVGVRSGRLSFINRKSSTKTASPTITETTTTDENAGIYVYPVKNYVGRNLASVGEIQGDYLVDEYGAGDVRLILVSNDGVYLNHEDSEQLQEYVVIAQNISADDTITVVHLKNSNGEPYSNLVDYMSTEEIVLYVAKIGEIVTEDDYNITYIKPSTDRRTYFIRDYVGRNLASFGTVYSNERVDEYGRGELVISFVSDDGSYIAYDDDDILSQYIVTEQSLDANIELDLEFETDSTGNENDYLIRSQNYEEITLYVQKYDGFESVSDIESEEEMISLQEEVADSNNLVIENYSFALSDCWEESGSKTEYKQYYAETGDKVAMLAISYPVDNTDTVTLDLLYEDNANMILAIESWYFDSCKVTGYEYFESDYGVSGILYDFNFKIEIESMGVYNGIGHMFCFPSPSDNRWFYVMYGATDNIDGDYTEDYMKLLASISEK